MTHVLEISFWVLIGTLFYTYGGFSLLLGLMGKVLNRRVERKDITPTVTLIIAAYNEQHGIAIKLDNALSLDYPKDRFEIIVASDGSDDATNTIVSDYSTKGVKLLELERRGKIFAIDDAVASASGEILIFSDANTLYHPDAVKMLVRNFADPDVGGVCGNQKHLDAQGQNNIEHGEHLYWVYDKWLKMMESLTGSIVSADGAIYAIRRSLYEMPKRTDVTDDFALSTGVIEKGYRLVFDEDALAHETASAGARDEFNRKVRIMNRGLRGVILRNRLLNPFRYGFYSIILFSHKVLRRLVPFVLMVLLGLSIVLAFNSIFFQFVTAAQIAFYALAEIGFLFRGREFGNTKLLYIPFFYCLANAAAFVAIVRLLRGKRIEAWQPKREQVDRHKLVNSEVV